MSPVELAHDAEGDGPPLVLIHAGVCDRRMWEPQWRALSERFRTVRCDLRGFGDSPLPPESFNNADDVLRRSAPEQKFPFIRKPFTREQLALRVREVLD